MFTPDIGIICQDRFVEQEVPERFNNRLMKYDFGELDEVSPAYDVSTYKQHGSECEAVVIPVAIQH